MKDKKLIFTAVLLAISFASYSLIIGEDIRTVEFLSILAIGILSGVFMVQFFHKFNKRKRKDLH